MGMVMGPQYAILSGLSASIFVYSHTRSQILAGVAGVIFTILGGLAYSYSPLPSHNGGWGLPPAQRQKWGFTSEPAEGQPEPRNSERFAWRPSLSGIYYATRQPEGDDSDGD